ncbi:hypothetical protein [Altericroceibacterium spongiae]|nr:hypothetical protein [Altericroceibacterium spongiae]
MIRPNVAPTSSVDDPGNLYDSDATVMQVFSHNAVYDRLCAPVG